MLVALCSMMQCLGKGSQLVCIFGHGLRAGKCLSSGGSTLCVKHLEEIDRVCPESPPCGSCLRQCVHLFCSKNTRSLTLGTLPERKEHLKGHHAEGKMVHPELVLLQKAWVRVRIEVFVAIDHQHPCCWGEVARITRDVACLVLFLPTVRADREAKVKDRELFLALLRFADEEVVGGDVAVVGNFRKCHEDGGHLRNQGGSGSTGTSQVSCSQSATRQRAV
mmetsp:Transcript_92544/g.183691  ORF Transcript_92544/g.183691 Transcript_92544/m.183691 type:complete len:221 (-) Transcript_92544:295-957(-)